MDEINIWMIQNLLKLNSDKMEFILLGTRQQLAKTGDISLHISSDTIIPVDNVRNLGHIMDSLLKNVHISIKSLVLAAVHYAILPK